ncbi:MAG TPA: methyltransferase domain-containing protein, partial [Cytophagaceae bacterium]
MSTHEGPMDRYQETFETWNKIALRYQEKFMHLELYNTNYDLICKSVTKQNAHLLEIGCGPGNITKYLLTTRPDFNVHGIDVAPNMVELAKMNNPTAFFEVMDAREIQKIEQTFDAIVCGFCLPYLSPLDCKKLIHDFKNLLNPNGLLYLSFVEGDPADSSFQSGSSGDRCFFYYHRLEDLKAVLTREGFV